MLDPGFWDDGQRARSLIQQLNDLKSWVKEVREIEGWLEDLEILVMLVEEETPGEQGELKGEISEKLKKAGEGLEDLSLKLLLNEKYDDCQAILALHPGAGGTESQDWTEMLFRMYTRWAEGAGYEVELLDLLPGDEAGIKSVTFSVRGNHAYGYLKSEKGVHRLVRISPFDTSGRRHTSFASVDVMPEIEDNLEIEVDPEDLRVDTFRSSGAGGQHVNKTDSAVRITHLPTGIVVQCQNERSQISNREQAMRILRAKLAALYQSERAEHLSQIRGEQKEIAWGSQIRSYTFHPYSLVKDHRTGVEVGNANGVMDGQLDLFIDSYLRHRAREKEVGGD